MRASYHRSRDSGSCICPVEESPIKDDKIMCLFVMSNQGEFLNYHIWQKLGPENVANKLRNMIWRPNVGTSFLNVGTNKKCVEPNKNGSIIAETHHIVMAYSVVSTALHSTLCVVCHRP